MDYPIFPGMREPKGNVLLWRADHNCWVIGNFNTFRHWVGNSELAYTFWRALPPKPVETH